MIPAREGGSLLAHDPVATVPFQNALANPGSKSLIFVQDWIKVVRDVEIIILTTAWEEYLRLAELDISEKIVFDCRALFDNHSLAVKKYLKFGSA